LIFDIYLNNSKVAPEKKFYRFTCSVGYMVQKRVVTLDHDVAARTLICMISTSARSSSVSRSKFESKNRSASNNRPTAKICS